MRQWTNNERGVTLAELIIYIVIAIWLLTIIGEAFTCSLKCWQQESRRTEAQQSVRMALDAMVRELREAVWIEPANANDEISFIEPAEHKKVRLFKRAGILYRDSDTPQPVAGVKNQLSVTKLSFSVSHNPSVVDIEISIAWRGWNGEENTESAKTTVYCVNSRPQN